MSPESPLVARAESCDISRTMILLQTPQGGRGGGAINASVILRGEQNDVLNDILGDPGADSGSVGKSKRATKKAGEEKSSARQLKEKVKKTL